MQRSIYTPLIFSGIFTPCDSFKSTLIYASSIFFPTIIYDGFSLILILVKMSVLSIYPATLSAGSDDSWQLPHAYILYPLYSFGLWLVVIIIPRMHFKYLTAKDNSGVALNESKTYAVIPFTEGTLAHSFANSSDIFLES